MTWTPDQIATLRQLYPAGDVAAVARAVGHSVGATKVQAARLGLRVLGGGARKGRSGRRRTPDAQLRAAAEVKLSEGGTLADAASVGRVSAATVRAWMRANVAPTQ